MLDDAARTVRLKLPVIGGSVALVAALLFAAFAGVLLVVFRHGA